MTMTMTMTTNAPNPTNLRFARGKALAAVNHAIFMAHTLTPGDSLALGAARSAVKDAFDAVSAFRFAHDNYSADLINYTLFLDRTITNVSEYLDAVK